MTSYDKGNPPQYLTRIIICAKFDIGLLQVPIMIVGDKTYPITLFGEGITPDQQDVEKQGSKIPDKQAVLLDNQLAVLSNEAVDFGVVPTFSVTKKVIFITNTSKETITFRSVLYMSCSALFIVNLL